MPQMNGPFLSIVIPVYNEAESLEELVRRCRQAAVRTGHAYEMILVDDASQDMTPEVLAHVDNHVGLIVLRLKSNKGQIAATMEGLRVAKGRIVLVLDGDLQDPPEVIPELVHVLEQAPSDIGVVFAVKVPLGGQAWFRLGHFVHSMLLARLSGKRLPVGAGSFCALRDATVERLVRRNARWGNLSAVIAAQDVPWLAVPYHKEERYHGQSRVGALGLIVESVASLMIVAAGFLRSSRNGRAP